MAGTNMSAFDLRLKRIKQGLGGGEQSGQWPDGSIGSPTDRGPAPAGINPATNQPVVKRISMRKQKGPSYA